MYDFFKAYGGQLTSMGKFESKNLAREMKLTDKTAKKYASDAKTQTMDEQDFDLKFQATKTVQPGVVNHDLSLVRQKVTDQEAKECLFRYEFPELLIRIAEFRYKEKFLQKDDPMAKTFVEAVIMLHQQVLKPFYDELTSMWQGFREE